MCNPQVDAVENPSVPLDMTPQQSTLLNNILVYVSGWVVKKALMKTGCNTCRNVIVTTSAGPKHQEAFVFLKLKNNGGLIFPSDGVLRVVKAAERHLRQLCNSNVTTANSRMKLLHVQSRVMAELAHLDVFDMGDHILNTAEGIDNHHFSLIKKIVEIFYNIRQHHMIKLHNLNLHKKNIRQKSTKTIIFLGQ